MPKLDAADFIRFIDSVFQLKTKYGIWVYNLLCFQPDRSLISDLGDYQKVIDLLQELAIEDGVL